MAYVRDERGRERWMPYKSYLMMKEAGRKVKLLAKRETVAGEDLDELEREIERKRKEEQRIKEELKMKREEALRQYRSKLLDSINMLNDLYDKCYGALQAMAHTLDFTTDEAEFSKLSSELRRQRSTLESILSLRSRSR